MSIQNIPAEQQPFKYIFGLGLSNNASNPDEVVDIAVGQCRDSNDNIDIVSDTVLTVNNLASGAGGLDTGSVAASKVYAIFMIADSSRSNPVDAIMTLASNSSPLMPFGYDSYRKIGYSVTDGSSDFLLFYQYGSGSNRSFNYDAPIATAVTAGNATSYTAVNLSTFVPADENLPVSLAFAFTPGAASRTLKMTPGNAVGDAVTVTGQVTSVVVSGNTIVMARVTSAVPEVDYKVANSGDAVAINVAGFNFTV